MELEFTEETLAKGEAISKQIDTCAHEICDLLTRQIHNTPEKDRPTLYVSQVIAIALLLGDSVRDSFEHSEQVMKNVVLLLQNGKLALPTIVENVLNTNLETD